LLPSLTAVEAIVGATAAGGAKKTNPPVITGALDDDTAALVAVEVVVGATAAGTAPKENPPVVTGALDDGTAALVAAGADA
jgi:hypothetical protein